MNGYTVVDHAADYAFRAQAADFPGLVRTCIMATIDAMFGLEAVRPGEASEFHIEPADREMTVFQALSEVLFLVDARGLIPAVVSVEQSPDGGIDVRALCDRMDPTRHRHRVLFKAATLHGLEVSETADGLEATVVMDT